MSFGRYPDAADAWYAMPVTLGGSNRLSGALDLRITEVMYHPPLDPAHPEHSALLEYVELYNPTPSPITSEVLGPCRGGMDRCSPVVTPGFTLKIAPHREGLRR